MAISIRNSQAEKLARELAESRGETITETVLDALTELKRNSRPKTLGNSLYHELMAISDRCSRLPTLDSRSDEEILGYDKIGSFDGD
ncbi:MAG: type II toxin-antitoxin system VapB family antitoxin [Spirochaetaceae bacterium]|nr:type II toxin-antitoxin system VapB family antitoxin [Spirochaetaceae bacterium]